MSATTGLLRPGLLAGVSVLVAGAPEPAGALGGAVSGACAELGARVSVCVVDAFADEGAVEETVGSACAEVGRPDLLVVDGAGLFVRETARETDAGGEGEDAGGEDEDTGEDAGRGDAGGESARAALSACLDAVWNVTRAVATRAFLVDEPGPVGGRVVYLAPAPGTGTHAEAARAGLENLARTLSIEWARHAITLVTIALGETTPMGEVAALCAYLASPAGAYFSGCLLDLRGAGRVEDKEGMRSP